MVTPAPQDRWSQDKHIELVIIIGNPGEGMLTRAMAKQISDALAHECLFVYFLSKEEPKNVFEALKHPGWVDAMQDELNQFSKNKVWTLVPAPYGNTIIGLRWQEGIDYDETFAPVARLEAIRIFLAFATYINFIVYQMDVKSAFLIGKAKDEEYRGMIGSLMYLTASRPDIQFTTCLCARYQANPKESYLIAVKRIFRYLKGTPSLGLWYPKCLGFDLKGYSDSDYAGCKLDRKKNLSLIPKRYHFIRDHILKEDGTLNYIELDFIPTQYQLADIFTKPLDEATFKRLIVELGMLNIDSRPEPSVQTKEN
ncbi:retrovirus-related pol polyprotein from transposon TNT 1-94 [Tanacetum coccineum]|uniref:Retrovirus-related pol polyprotein from transposon TNT 1-94 n=1 Tax=Tanacetum coccineum TaxID=301880 RepID=A0ABQ5F1W2_9ASTR